jgi:hypothetical protein
MEHRHIIEIPTQVLLSSTLYLTDDLSLYTVILLCNGVRSVIWVSLHSGIEVVIYIFRSMSTYHIFSGVAAP